MAYDYAPLARDDKSGWLRVILPLSKDNFDRLNKDIRGFPVYYNEDQVWPAPVEGVSVIWQP